MYMLLKYIYIRFTKIFYLQIYNEHNSPLNSVLGFHAVLNVSAVR